MTLRESFVAQAPRWLLSAAGALLMLAGIGLLTATEGDLIAHGKASAQQAGPVRDLGSRSMPEPDQLGSMVRVSGPLQVVEQPRDPDFNQQVAAPVLSRRVEMFQWHEVGSGDQLHYELDWADHPIDSSRFRIVAGHLNPGRFPLSSQRFVAGRVEVSGFILSVPLLDALPGSASFNPDVRKLPANLAASFSPFQNFLVTSSKPGQPQLGDLRISWETVPIQDISVFAQVEGNRLVPGKIAGNAQGFELQTGDMSMAHLLPSVPPAPTYPWLRRLAALLLAIAGAWLLVRVNYRTRVDPWLALALGVLPIAVIAAMLWIGNSYIAVGGWLLLAALAGVLMLWRVRLAALPN